ncbi:MULTISPECIES: YybS family protein [Bacillus cereus group]|uniref:DUF2232 domain-containing protein n=1 Tax=Bacillus cytotoxicus (strain DSM 22905 / CIP 110041 / 391-98 / NVH 391-98) TaxID=315749 RepID=A7GVN4_BACCN|nr:MULTISPECIES: YybS family protein [Bacillus cereus group]ABS24192.1 conserved hypothetical protein [Bacillus cytotoxicus NVH 391-98]AWC30737.1 DUF2232 domain-containing protein [Bacillus cytotoxicus]AWC42878.1 DUF2232 domain-containing protein [Bacillus cytotoxicus]AWC46784.1 DUF2232 domain-containing protein [Bacillus cytotoxicus]AWC50809.1 DUF2232 domain-containing protein [Bacillus cytotoxicus]
MKGTRIITEGAALLAIYAVLLLVSLYVPILSLVATFALPLPFILFIIRYSLPSACMLFVVSLLVTLVVSSPISLVKTVMCGIIGFTLGYMYKKKRQPVEILIIGTLSYLVCFLFIYIGSIKFLQLDLMKQMQDMFKEGIEQSEKIIKAAGVPVSQEQKAELEQLMGLLRNLLPSILVMVALIYSWLTVLIAGNVLRKLRYPIVKWPEFRNMQLPKSIIWYYVLLIICSAFIKAEPSSYFDIAFSNVYFIFSILLLFQGFGFITFLAHAKGYSKAIPIVGFVICMFVPQLFSLVTILGIIDLGFPFRSRIKSK